MLIEMTQTEVEVLAQKLDGISDDLTELKILAKQTNGRVTQLEKREIGREAAQAEREKMIVAAERVGEKRFDRLTPLLVGTFLVSLGAVLGHFL